MVYTDIPVIVVVVVVPAKEALRAANLAGSLLRNKHKIMVKGHQAQTHKIMVKGHHTQKVTRSW